MNKDYSKYNWQNLVEDQQFLDWLQNDVKPMHPNWMELFQQYPELKIQADQAIEFLNQLKFKDLALNTKAQTMLWERIESSIQIGEKTNKFKLFGNYIWPYVAAASILLVILFKSVLFPTGNVDLKTDFAQKLEKSLPDGSKIEMNAGSTLSYDESTFKEKRLLKLDGEAYFSVQKGSDFSVNTTSGTVKVLGTEFNVFDREGRMEVHCYSGRVLVQFNNSKETYILQAGEKVNNFNTETTKQEFSTLELKMWKDGFIYYENADLTDVLQEFKRQYDLKDINLSQELGKLKYTGFFKTNQREEAIQSISLPMQLNFEIKEGILTVTKK
ncbi:MAG: FecR family protein [Saprospiraceae bacterium]|nr:FecR family protein [Saprospiraceae bacterium]MBK9631012.1 FecR family protein [Saprospiraceae bacterium]